MEKERRSELSVFLDIILSSLIVRANPSTNLTEKKSKEKLDNQSTTRGIRRARKKEKIDGNRQVRFHFRFELLVWYCWIVGRMGLLLGPG